MVERGSAGALVSIVLLVVALLAAVPSAAHAQARAASCPDRSFYPGDDASRLAVAGWMAYGASLADLPDELPVMAALVESDLENLDFGDGDRMGYFAMRTSIWNTGTYAGFPTDPPLQLKWFVDQALAVKQQRVAEGKPLDPGSYGEWVADVERPAEHLRGLYQLRLDDAKQLIGPTCLEPSLPGGGGDPEPTPPPGDPPVDDGTPPVLRLARPNASKALATRRVGMVASCPAEACTLQARGTVALPGAAGVYRVRSAKRAAAAGASVTLRLPLGRALRKAARRAIADGRRVRMRIAVVATDASGNARSAKRTIRLR